MGQFLLLAFAISWTVAGLLYLIGIDLATIQGRLFGVIGIMWGPALSAIIVQRWSGGSIRSRCGLTVGKLRWVAIAWLAPAGLIPLAIGIGILIPGVTVASDLAAQLLALGLTEAQAQEAVEQLEAVPLPVLSILLLQGLAAGLTINAVAALGEELGWRGLLLAELAPLGFWNVSALTGVIWGIWHAPVILQGHNFPEQPILGILVMTIATIVLSPIYTYLTVRAGTVIAPTLLHGSFNGVGSVTLIYLVGAGALVTAPVGLVGILAAVVGVGICLAHDRMVADTPITTGEPLSPWAS